MPPACRQRASAEASTVAVLPHFTAVAVSIVLATVVDVVALIAVIWIESDARCSRPYRGWLLSAIMLGWPSSSPLGKAARSVAA